MKTKIENFLANLDTEIDLLYMVDIDNIDFENAFDSICDMINDNNGFDFDVIYYSNAMNYLRENDPSLRESLSLAHEIGYNLNNLSSEILASLLKTENVKNDFYNLENDINDFFEDLEEEEEEEDED